METDELLRQITALKAENMYLKTKNSRLDLKVQDLKETLEEMIRQNHALGESLLQSSGLSVEKETKEHPLEASILFDDVVTLPEPESQEEEKKRSRLKKLAHDYKNVIYVAKKFNKIASGCQTALKIGKYLTLLLL